MKEEVYNLPDRLQGTISYRACPYCTTAYTIPYPEITMSETKDAETARLIQSALAGDRGPDQKRIAEQGVDFIGTLLRKNNDYGSSVWKKPLLAPNTDVAAAILVRMTDKVERLISLQQKKSEVTEESFDDTMKDLGAYALLYLARPKN